MVSLMLLHIMGLKELSDKFRLEMNIFSFEIFKDDRKQ